MAIPVRDLLTDQIFGLNGLINLANIAFLLAFALRDVLILRVLALVSDVLIIPYYYFQHKPLWPPIFWGLAFAIVNGAQIVALISERRPVILSKKEEELHRVAFATVDKREFLKMASLARWIELPPGMLIFRKDHRISDAVILLSGEIDAVLDSKVIWVYRPGQLIGNVSAYSGLVSPVDVVTRGQTRLAMWDMEQMAEFAANRPELRAQLLHIMSTDLAAKLHETLINR
jgi:Popeye protein conserved region